MSRRIHKEFLTSRFFLIGLFLLIFNDHFLKYAYPSFLTGKLSDFAGLFIFPIFFSVFRYDKRKLIYVLTGIGFVFWKSSFSQPIIDLLSLSRVVDYSDLMALIILPISLKYINEYKVKKVNFEVLKPFIVGVFSLVAFVATTLPKKGGEINLEIGKDYLLPFDKKEFLLRQEEKIYNSSNGKIYQDDSLFYCHFNIPIKSVSFFAVVTVTEEDKRAKIHLDSIISYTYSGNDMSKKDIDYVNNLKVKDYEKFFKENVIYLMSNNSESQKGHYFFINKRMNDERMEKYKN